VKVLQLTPSFHPAYVYGGPTESVYQLCRELALAGCDLRVLTTDANGRNEVLDVDTKADVPFPEGFRARYCRRIAAHSVSPTLLRLLSGAIRRADVVHITGVYNFPTIPGLALCRLHGKPVVWSPRGALSRWEEVGRPLAKEVWDRVCSAVRPGRLVLHMTSPKEQAECAARLPWLESRVIPNGVRIPDEIRRSERPDRLRLLYLGRLDPIKGIENLLEACADLTLGDGRDWSLRIAGGGTPGYTDELARIAAASSGRATLVGEARGEAKRALFEDADLVVVPSFSENFGIVVAEALAHGVPVIAGRGTPWERLEQIGAGLWVENDPASLAAAIERAAREPLVEMGDRGRRWMQQEYSWSAVAEQMAALYAELRDPPPGG
jgi:glycosyltransferase involved in cell wall biosynthesis